MFASTWYVELDGSWSAVFEDDSRKGELRVRPFGRGRNRSWTWEVIRPLVHRGVQSLAGVELSQEAAQKQAELACTLLGRSLKGSDAAG